MFTKVEGFHDYYLNKKKFDNVTYYLWVIIEFNKAYISLSSGRKRKHRLTFQDKEDISKVGINPLIWAKNEIINLHLYKLFSNVKYIYIFPSDSRKRRIYLKSMGKFGFKECRDANYGIGIFKTIKNP